MIEEELRVEEQAYGFMISHHGQVITECHVFGLGAFVYFAGHSFPPLCELCQEGVDLSIFTADLFVNAVDALIDPRLDPLQMYLANETGHSAVSGHTPGWVGNAARRCGINVVVDVRRQLTVNILIGYSKGPPSGNRDMAIEIIAGPEHAAAHLKIITATT